MISNSNTKRSFTVVDGKVVLTASDMRKNAKLISNPTKTTKEVLVAVATEQENKLGNTHTL